MSEDDSETVASCCTIKYDESVAVALCLNVIRELSEVDDVCLRVTLEDIANDAGACTIN